jgi:hypothetical protein
MICDNIVIEMLRFKREADISLFTYTLIAQPKATSHKVAQKPLLGEQHKHL